MAMHETWVHVTQSYLNELYTRISDQKKTIAHLLRQDSCFLDVSQSEEDEPEMQSRRGDSNSRPLHYE